MRELGAPVCFSAGSSAETRVASATARMAKPPRTIGRLLLDNMGEPLVDTQRRTGPLVYEHRISKRVSPIGGSSLRFIGRNKGVVGAMKCNARSAPTGVTPARGSAPAAGGLPAPCARRRA